MGEEVRRSWGERAHPLFHSWHGPVEMREIVSDVVDADSIQAAWRAGGPEALAAALRSDDGAWGPLANLIREHPEPLLELAPHLGPQDGDRLVSYFSGYESLLGNQTSAPTFPWDPLIDLMERTTGPSGKHTRNGGTDSPTHRARDHYRAQPYPRRTPDPRSSRDGTNPGSVRPADRDGCRARRTDRSGPPAQPHRWPGGRRLHARRLAAAIVPGTKRSGAYQKVRALGSTRP